MIYGVQVVFRRVEQDQLQWFIPSDLFAKLTSNRASGSRDENATAFDHLAKFITTQHDDRPPEQVLRRQSRGDGTATSVARQDISGTRQIGDAHAQGLGSGEQCIGIVTDTFFGDENTLRVGPQASHSYYNLGEVLYLAENRHAVDRTSDIASVP